MKFEHLGPYRVDKLLGQGGMGSVYLGTHVKSNETVALKIIASSLADQERFRRRFAAEVEMLKRIKHPNIVQLIGYGEEQGHLFYSMEYVSGFSMAELLKKKGNFTWQQSLDIAIAICSALKHAHDLGIIHRDLKPANVMLNEENQVKLTDFGIGKLFGSSEVTAAGSVLGTADYMPPEQAEGNPVTVRSDLYALGATLFAAISGRSPHAAKSTPEVLYNVRYTIPKLLTELAPGTPLEISEIVAELLQKEASMRPPTALVVGNRFQALKHGLQHRSEKTESKLAAEAAAAGEFTSIDIRIDPELARANTELAPVADPQGDEVNEKGTAATQMLPSVDSADFTIPTMRKSRMELAAAPTQSASKAISKAPLTRATQSDEKETGSGTSQTRFTVVEESERQQSSFTHAQVEEDNHLRQWISVGFLVALLLAAIASIFYLTRAPTADQLYNEITQAIESGSEDQLSDIEPIIEQFEQLYPNDPRVKELEPVKGEIEQQRTVRRLLRRARSIAGPSELDPIEQAFLDCLKAQDQDTATARKKWSALLTLFQNEEALQPKHQKLLDLAEQSLNQLQKTGEERINPAVELLEQQIAWIEQHVDKEKHKAAYEAIIELYGDKPWASSIVAKAKKVINGK